MIFVFGSSARYSRKSLSSTSALLPREMNAENPISLSTLQSLTPVMMAPDWLIMAMLPSFGVSGAKVELCLRLMMPRQFGPSTRMPAALHRSMNWASSFEPSAPTSLNPAVMTTMALTHLVTQPSIASKIALAGMQMTARSTSSGISVTDATHGNPSHSVSPFGFTAYTVVSMLLSRKLRMTALPTLP